MTETTMLLKDADSDRDHGTLSPLPKVFDTRDWTERKGSILTFHHVNYTIRVKDRNTLCGAVSKDVLIDVSGMFSPGLNAIMGPTGCGKSTLIDILIGQKDPQGLSGDILIDGKVRPTNFAFMTGYVVQVDVVLGVLTVCYQDDVVLGVLTVRENIMFSANLRLNKKTFNRERRELLVKQVISELGLKHCADTLVGNQQIRGVSGGERKRTSIGMELVVSQNILFLDEPTSGLDSFTALTVIMLLKKLSKSGRTIVMSIHQPRYSIYKHLDRLLLLAAGRTVYHGPASQALDYFADIGYNCEERENPSDFFLDVINGNVKPAASQGESGGSSETERRLSASFFSEKFQNSTWGQQLDMLLDPLLMAYADRLDKNCFDNVKNGTYASSFFAQLKYVGERTILRSIRQPRGTIAEVLTGLSLGLLTGLIYFQIDKNIDDGIQNRAGLLFLISTKQVILNIPYASTFVRDRNQLLHETASGYYHAVVYLFTKFFCDILISQFFSTLFYAILIYFMADLQIAVHKFLIFFFTLLITSMTGCSIALAVGALQTEVLVAQQAAAKIFTLMMMFGGLLVNLDTMGAWLSWLQYISLVKYASSALLINELGDLTLYVYNGTDYDIPNTEAAPLYLDRQGISHAGPWDLWMNHVIIMSIFAAAFIITVVQMSLLRVKK